jgi:hypothetical protein
MNGISASMLAALIVLTLLSTIVVLRLSVSAQPIHL